MEVKINLKTEYSATLMIRMKINNFNALFIFFDFGILGGSSLFSKSFFQFVYIYINMNSWKIYLKSLNSRFFIKKYDFSSLCVNVKRHLSLLSIFFNEYKKGLEKIFRLKIFLAWWRDTWEHPSSLIIFEWWWVTI